MKDLRCRFWIKVSSHPKLPHNECLGWEENFLKIKIKALRANGKANEELIAYLSLLLKTPKSRITIESGHTSSIKQIEVLGLSLEDVKKKT